MMNEILHFLAKQVATRNSLRFKWMPDAMYLKIKYYYALGKRLDLKNPKTYNEKLQWLKLYDRNPIYTIMVDKAEAKNYVTSIIGDEYIIPTLGVWDNFDDIDFDELPDQFVLKCTHDSGGLVICKDRKEFDREEAKRKIESTLKQNYFYNGREWPYKNVKPRILAEQYMEDIKIGELRDYKFFTFDGDPQMVLVCSNRFSTDGLKEDFFDKNWQHMNIRRPTNRNSLVEIPKPTQYEKMVKLVTTLSKRIPFVRVDFYEINHKVYFSEMTFFPMSGFEGFVPEQWDLKIGEKLNLPIEKNK